MVSSMNQISSHPVGLYSLSALSVMLLSKKEGWLALSSTVVLVVSCVLRAMLSGRQLGDVTPKSKGRVPGSRSRLRVDAESFVPRNYVNKPKPAATAVHNLHVSQYRNLLAAATDDSSTDDSSPRPRAEQKVAPRRVTPPEPGFAPPPGLPEPTKIPPWKLCKQEPVEDSRALEARALLARLIELEKDSPVSLTQDGRARKPAGKRVVAGVRESLRAVANGKAVAILVAHDLNRTADGKLEEPKMQKMVDDAQEKGVAVAVSLSRAELGDTISKDVSSAVLAVLDVTGAEEAFQRFLHASAGGHTPAPAA